MKSLIERGLAVELSDGMYCLKSNAIYDNYYGCYVHKRYAFRYVLINDEYYDEDCDGICYLNDVHKYGFENDNYLCADGNWYSEYEYENECNNELYYDLEMARAYAFEHEDGGFYSYEEEFDTLAEYHKDTSPIYKESISSGWAFGIEFEKQDFSVRNYLSYHDLPYGWRKEEDGSLDSDTGFEFITPIYDLFSDKFKEDVENDVDLLKHINASLFCDETDSEKEFACGGHFSISNNNINAYELIHKLSGSLPLIYSLYNGRMNNSYCEPKNKREYGCGRFALNPSGRRLEFRIFSGCPNLKTALWRIDLMRIITKQFYGKSEKFVYSKMTNKRTKLYKHLQKVYSDEKIKTKCDLFVKYSELYGDSIQGQA